MTPLTQKPGYSGKSLATKLGVKPGQQLLAIDAPVNYAQMVAPLPEGATIRLGTWGETTGSAGLIHAFFSNRKMLAAHLGELIELPAPRGILWIPWPKKSSPLFRDLTDQEVRALVLPAGWVDVKVAAVDVDWSGLKFLTRISR